MRSRRALKGRVGARPPRVPACSLLPLQAARAAALQHLHQRLFDPAVQRQALQQLQSLWPGLLALLWEDPSSAVTAAAAPAVGAIGALAAQASAAAAAARAASGAVPQAGGSAAAPSAAGLLFDWLLPALQRRVTPSGHPLEPHQLSAVLLALRDCLTGERGSAHSSCCSCPCKVCGRCCRCYIKHARANPACPPASLPARPPARPPPFPPACLPACPPPCACVQQRKLPVAAGVDAATLARFAEPSLAACQALLESEATPPAALPPLLAALQQAARHQPSLK